jgi:hypothetical protein
VQPGGGAAAAEEEAAVGREVERVVGRESATARFTKTCSEYERGVQR